MLCRLTVTASVLTFLQLGVQAQWFVQRSPTKERLRGLSVVDSRVAWASGNHGTVLVTTDGGVSWKLVPFPGGSDLDFRDVHGVGERVAYLLSIGAGRKSRIYKTTDGGMKWHLQLTLQDPRGFLDAFAFWDAEHGIAMGDPIEGRFVILATDDGGSHWNAIPSKGMPVALDGEGAFAASGSCLVIEGKKNAWFGTGGGSASRVFHSADGGQSWSVNETPIPGGNASSGVFSLSFRDANHGVAVGGDYKQPDRAGCVIAITANGGRTWKTVEDPGPRSFRSCVVYLPYRTRPTFVAVGPSGVDFSENDGASWFPLSNSGAHAVDSRESEWGVAVGEDGTIARFKIAKNRLGNP